MRKDSANSKHKRTRKLSVIGWAIILVVASIVVWFLVWLSVFLLKGFVPPDDAATLGQTGDMFGAASALFSAFGFVGILIVLFWDSQQRKLDLHDRRRARRPFLVPRAAPDDPTTRQSASQVIRAKWNGAHFELQGAINLQIENLSDEPALNVGVTVSLEKPNVSAKSTLGLPINRSESEYVELRLNGHDSVQSQEIANELLSGVILTVEVDYESLEGIRWVSSVRYKLSVGGTDLQKALEKTNPDYIEFDDETGGGGPTNQTYFDIVPVPNSWRQAEL